MRKNLFVAATAAIALMAGFASAQEVRLRAAMFVPPTTAFGEPFKKFIDHVNETGKGKGCRRSKRRDSPVKQRCDNLVERIEHAPLLLRRSEDLSHRRSYSGCRICCRTALTGIKLP